jgi:predicted alpha/beta hydrolase family esterase
MHTPAILFIQGGGAGAHEADRHLADDLQTTLRDTFDVCFPLMPDEEEPDYAKFRDAIAAELKNLSGSIVLVGHSLGSCFLLKYLSEEPVVNAIAGAFLIATPYWGDGGWTYEGFRLRDDFASRLPANMPLFLYHSTNDETVPFAHLGLYARTLPHAATREIVGRGHQLGNDVHEVVQDIQSLDIAA